MHTQLVLRSALTGRAARELAAFGNDFTNNGLALSPDGRTVYFTLIPRTRQSPNLLIERLNVATRRYAVVAHGWEPSLSPSGRLLAYISEHGHSESVAVKDLTTGVTRSINVDAAVGRGHVLAEMPSGWMSDNTTLALPVTLPATPDSRAQLPARASQAQDPHAAVRMIIVQAKRDQPLSVHRIAVAGLRGYLQILAPDTNSRHGLIAASLIRRGEALSEIQFSQGTAETCRLLNIRRGSVLAFDQTGRRLLYMLGARSPSLWRATIKHNILIARRKLINKSSVGVVAW